MQAMDVGLMPLMDNTWARGKCSFKMLQYMSCSLPVIVSPVGMNAEVLELGTLGLPAITDDDWCQALEFFYGHEQLRYEYGCNGRMVVEQFFSRKVISEKIIQIFRQLV